MVDTILTPINECEVPQTVATDQESFLVENYFSELTTEAEKGIARENLGVYGKQDVYTQVDVDNNIYKAVGDSMKSHLASDDPHQILPKVTNLLLDYVKKDGTTPFTAPQVGVEPLLGNHLTTKNFVTNLLNSHVKKTDPHDVMGLVTEELKQYTLAKNVYEKSEVYTKPQVDKMVKSYVKTDGTTPFTAPQSGVTPIIDQHLATKRYVDNVMFKHEVGVDPHGFLTILNQRLNYYYKTTETYSKQETYSRAQIDQIINTLVCDAAQQALKEHLNQFDPHGILKEVYSKHYVTRDGSVPFTAVQKGVAGIEDNDLATLGQIKEVNNQLVEAIEKYQPVWITSGPVQTTVGFVEDESSLPQTMTFQEIMDAIFYGNILDVQTPEIAAIGTTIPITMSIRGNALIEKAELYQNEKLIGTFDRGNFLDWKYTIDSEPIFVDTTFTFKVTFMNGAESSAQCITKVSYGVFLGIVPKMCMPGDLTYDLLLDLSERNPENNVIRGDIGENVTEIKHRYNFVSPISPRKITLAIPKSYNQVDYMHTASQHFDRDAFDIADVPIIIPNVGAVIYTVYMYNEPLVAFNSEVIFKLSRHE